MAFRAILASFAVAAVIPLAAPVARAESNDCVVLTNYGDNINDLIRQVNASIEAGRGKDSWEEEQPFIAQAGELAHTAASQLHGAASRLISPMYQRLIATLASDYDLEASALTDYAKKGPGSPQNLGTVAQRVSDHSDYYDNALNAACSA